MIDYTKPFFHNYLRLILSKNARKLLETVYDPEIIAEREIAGLLKIIGCKHVEL